MGASKIIKLISIGFIAVAIIVSLKSVDIYKKAFSPSVKITNDTEFALYVKSDYTFDSVLKVLEDAGIIKDIKDFKWTAKRKNYSAHVNSGKFIIRNRSSNNEVVNKLRSGSQEPVKLRFNNLRTLSDLSDRIAEQLEIESSDLLEYISDADVQAKYTMNAHTMACMFIPNTYEVYWNISKEALVERMHKEYKAFWTKSRLAKAEQIKLTPEEVITLASIVNLETRKNDEKNVVAGVYMNRIKIGMRLQADPTIIFAYNNFDMKRVLNKHKKIDSPYNTYKYAGLPPGPICIPDISSIDAVLNYNKHKYIYFCARSDFSGYHNFAKTLSQHNRNAAAYQKELNKRRIYK